MAKTNDISKALGNVKKALEDVPKVALKVLVVETDKSIKLNFREQGRPDKWAKKKKPDGRAILTGRTGRLQRTINVQGNPGAMKVEAGSNLPYAKIHNEGGTIDMPARKYKFKNSSKLTKKGKRRTVFASSKAKRFKKEAQGKGYKVVMPRRNFLNLTKKDFQRAGESIKNRLKK